MKLYPFIAIAGTLALSSCGNMNEPIYYDDESMPVKKSTAPANPTPTQATTITTTTKLQSLPKNNSPFMQPDVYGMPSNDDLKETSSSTRKSNSTSGLTVPN